MQYIIYDNMYIINKNVIDLEKIAFLSKIINDMPLTNAAMYAIM